MKELLGIGSRTHPMFPRRTIGEELFGFRAYLIDNRMLALPNRDESLRKPDSSVPQFGQLEEFHRDSNCTARDESLLMPLLSHDRCVTCRCINVHEYESELADESLRKFFTFDRRMAGKFADIYAIRTRTQMQHAMCCTPTRSPMNRTRQARTTQHSSATRSNTKP